MKTQDFEKRIAALENNDDCSGISLFRAVNKTGLIWGLAVGRMMNPKAIYYGNTIEDVLQQAEAESQKVDRADLNKYCGTIDLVFSTLAKIYDDGDSGPVLDIVCDLRTILDADTCAEIIAEAQAVEVQS